MRTMDSTARDLEPIRPATDLAPGSHAGPWRIERELGRGGMGAVYAVVHTEIGKRAALKIVHRHLLVPGFNPDRMLLEAKVVNQVGHPGIVDIFETGALADGRPYIVMERLEGHSLAQRADAGPLPPRLTLSILIQICDALIAAHAAGIVHRDLKLDNVFLVPNAEDPSTPKVKLLDWGIAKVINTDVRHTIEGQLVGTPQYLAPEQARGQAVSPQTDVYSLGVMAYELVTDVLPFEAETAAEIMTMHLRAVPQPPSELVPDIAPALEALILSMLAKAPAERPTTVEVANELEVIRDELVRAETAQAVALVTPGVVSELPARLDESAPLRRSGKMIVSRATTQPAPVARAPRRAWKAAVGMAALAAAALAFGFSGGSESRSAEAALQPAAVAPAVAPPPPPAVQIVDVEVVPEAKPARARTTAAHAKAAHAKAARAKARTRAAGSPHRGSKLDPDGTLDAYK